MQELDSNLAMELRIVGSIDDAHCAFADHFDEHVAANCGAALECKGVSRLATRITGASSDGGNEDATCITAIEMCIYIVSTVIRELSKN